LLKLVDLDGFGPRATSELSGGEAQRVALARALAPQPALLMLDEPLGSLDRALRDQLTGDLRRLLTSLGQTALHVTHDQAEAFALADRVAVVADGRPVAVGTPAELWADPGSRFVAEFLGHSNIWSVSVDGAGAVVWANQLLGHLPQDHALRACEAGECLAVMPAAGLRVDHSANGAGRCRLAVTVTESVFRRGVHDVSAVMDSARSEWPLTFTTPESVRVGDSLALSVDVAALRPLTDP
jgi:thiamine transport system ATP-binding protein